MVEYWTPLLLEALASSSAKKRLEVSKFLAMESTSLLFSEKSSLDFDLGGVDLGGRGKVADRTSVSDGNCPKLCFFIGFR